MVGMSTPDSQESRGFSLKKLAVPDACMDRNAAEEEKFQARLEASKRSNSRFCFVLRLDYSRRFMWHFQTKK